ncbi:branched-chain amino acid ABC transporter permease [Chelatococcus asaccharovorans]|uniref:branched-chain amino acid ABC transporter permease n=1 Tax=Chelatococcus asaccharovorans TaxID=28210 RepID=UPI00224C6CEB|nr:branched-chain amino acid ABC transporter permease [Chelatococcus asaccharovorans]CAH1659660.1 Urea ABC transporter, permease protein UrtC [Chelatococcus asaccharovorans]CAH1684109.1 Urea ABC transporter, permease protein UrtC [Chelatococcus asaccharovorans]
MADCHPQAHRRGGRLILLELLVLLVLVLAPFVVSHYFTILLTRFLILALLALSFDLVWGYAGIMSFGQSLFFGAAAYAVAMAVKLTGSAPLIAVFPATLAIGAALALIIAILLFGRRIGASSAMLAALGTLTATYIAERIVRTTNVLGGQNGLSVPSAPSLGSFSIDLGVPFYVLALLTLLATYLICRFLVRSQLGLVLAGLRTDERRIAFLGYDVVVLRVITFTFAGAIGGLSGGLYALHEGFIAPNVIGVTLATQAVLYGLFGGIGTLIGPVIGVILIEGLSYKLADQFPYLWPILLGILLLLLVIFRPSGLVGLLVSDRERIGRFGTSRRASGQSS